MPLSVLASSAGDGGLACSTSLIILCLNVDHPTGGLLTIGDGIFSTEGLELGSSTLINSSSQLEELHQQWVLPHLSQNLQCLPKNVLSCFTSPSDSVWVIVAVYVGLVKICGGYPYPWPVGTSVSEASSSVYMFVILWGAFLFLDLIWHLWAFSHAWYLSVLVWGSWIMVNFSHEVLTLICTSRAPAGILQNRNLFRSQVALSDLLNAILKAKFCKY